MKHKEKKLSLLSRIKKNILFLFRLDQNPVIKVYNGYGSSERVIAFGHVLKLSPMMRKTYRHNWLVNVFSMLRLFMVKPYKYAKLSMEWEGTTIYTTTQDDGFFKFEWAPALAPQPGWYPVTVNLEDDTSYSNKIRGVGKVNIPYNSTYAFISDIDDTFLVSHSSRLRKRLYVLLTKNARSRKPFAGVVNHYQLLAASGQKENINNPFFYVSSSEWNLFDFIMEFSAKNGLPQGVYLLSELKKFKDVWSTGQNKHATKFFRIVRIVEAFPHLHFVLFGDDSQEDPNIYLSLVEHFTDKIYAVYIRRIHKNKYQRVQKVVDKILNAGIPCCYFIHSEEAIGHSKNIGLIS
ncbi:MAG: phosphatase domain-containing protein [Ginsengibacter sp.]